MSSSTSPNTSTINRPAPQSAQAGPSNSGNGSTPARSTTASSSRNLVSLLDDIDHPAPVPRPAPAPRQSTFPSMGQSTSSTHTRPEASSSRAPHAHGSSRLPHLANSRSNHPHALDQINVNAPTLQRPPVSQAYKQKLPAGPSRSHSFIISDDDDEDDIEEIVGSRVPPGMRKGREAPIVVHDSRPSMSRQPGSNHSTLSSSSSVQEVKPKVEQTYQTSRPALPTLASSLSRATDSKPKLSQTTDRVPPAASSITDRECKTLVHMLDTKTDNTDGAISSLTCCQPSRQEIYERYDRELRELRAWFTQLVSPSTRADGLQADAQSGVIG